VVHSAPIVVSIDEEDRLMGSCPCSGAWRMTANSVVIVESRWFDLLKVVCRSCGERRAFWFDISRFFVARPGIWLSCHNSVNTRRWAPLLDASELSNLGAAA
jgi:hypothetical protein